MGRSRRQIHLLHSSAHILAEAIQELFPSAKFGIGPPIENGFYYDVDFGNHTPQQEDLRALERKFLELARQKNKFSRISISKSDALTHYQKIGNEYKVDLIEGLENVEISFTSRVVLPIYVEVHMFLTQASSKLLH